MKLIPSLAGACAMVALAFHPAQSLAQDAVPDPGDGLAGNAGAHEASTTLSIKEETFSLPIAEASQLLHDVPTDALRYARLREMLAAGKARLERLMVLRTRSGQRAVVESTHELRYPTDFSTPQLPVPANAPDKPEEPPPPKSAFPSNPTTPVIFETRNIGDTLEVEAVLAPDGVTIDLNLVPQSVRYLGDRTVDGTPPVKQPIFESGKISTSVAVRDGHPYFLGTAHPAIANGFPGQQKEQRVWLDFLTVEVVRLPRTGANAKGSAATLARAQGILIPKLEFREASLVDAVDVLRKKSVELDPEKKGLNFVLKAPPNLAQTKITLSLTDVSLYDAARYVANLAALVVEPEESALLLRAAGETP